MATNTEPSAGFRENPQKALAVVVGGVLALVGVLGFFAGDMLIIFGINPLHNVVHLATGLLGLGAGFYIGGQYSGEYNRYLGLVYVLVFVLGLALPALMGSLLNVNMADNLLHLALGVVLAFVGFGFGSKN